MYLALNLSMVVLELLLSIMGATIKNLGLRCCSYASIIVSIELGGLRGVLSTVSTANYSVKFCRTCC